MVNMQTEKTVNPRAALLLLSSATLLRKMALQSATMPSPSDAKNVIKATGSNAPFGNEINGSLLLFGFFSDLKGIVIMGSMAKKMTMEVMVKCIGIATL